MSTKPTGFSGLFGMFAGTARAKQSKSVDPQAAFAHWEANEFPQSFGDVSGKEFEANNRTFAEFGGRVSVGESHSISHAFESIEHARATISAPAVGLRNPRR